MQFKLLALAAAALAAVLSQSSAQAQTRIKVGVLECRGGPSVGLVVASSTRFACDYRGTDNTTDHYVATSQRIGLDIGITDKTVLAWTVYAPTKQIGHGDLSGNYAGVAGNVSLGIGGGGNVLVGGSANSIALQPLSVQGQTGVNLAVGAAGFELRPARVVR